MESQIFKIMESLGRIEQKSDTALLSLVDIKISMKEQDKSIEELKSCQNTQKGEVRVMSAVISSITAVAVGIATWLFTSGKVQ